MFHSEFLIRLLLEPEDLELHLVRLLQAYLVLILFFPLLHLLVAVMVETIAVLVDLVDLVADLAEILEVDLQVDLEHLVKDMLEELLVVLVDLEVAELLLLEQRVLGLKETVLVEMAEMVIHQA